MHESFVFVSDVHIAPGNKDRAGRFSDFLDSIRQKEVSRLYILGDLFDYWVGPGHEKQPEYRGVLEGIRELSDSGVEVHLFRGNRDFFFDSKTARMAGAEAVDEMDLQIGEKTVHLCHGDHLCEDDRSYQILRTCMRSFLLRLVYQSLPFSLRDRLGRALTNITKTSVPKKSPETIGFSARAIERLLKRGVDILICGHTHTHSKDLIQYNGCQRVLYNLGDWAANGCYLLYKDNKFEFLHHQG